MNPDQELHALKREFARLFGHIQVIRKEVATLRGPAQNEPDAFATMSDQLAAVVESTEEASNAIMTTVDQMGVMLAEVESRTTDPETQELLGRLSGLAASIYEACAFQDLTGQRLARVVKLLKFVEGRVNSIIAMWGVAELQRVVASLKSDRSPEEAFLSGPQRKGQGVSQAEVDRLFTPAEAAPDETEVVFNQADIDKLFA